MIKKLFIKSMLFLVFFSAMLQATRLEVSDQELEAQEKIFSSKIDFYRAFKIAVLSFFNNGDDSESLRALISDKYSSQEQIQEELDRIFNDEQTVIKLVTSAISIVRLALKYLTKIGFLCLKSKTATIFFMPLLTVITLV